MNELLGHLCECPRAEEKRFLRTRSASNRRSLQQAIAQIEAQRNDRFNETVGIIIDIDGSRPHWLRGYRPCITRSRGGTGFYVPSCGRRLTLKEWLRLQGLPTSIVKYRDGITDRQLVQTIGNFGERECSLRPCAVRPHSSWPAN